MMVGWDVVKRWSCAERLALADAAQKIGLEGRVGRARFQDLALEVLNIAMTGLARQHALNERGDDESIYLLRMLDQIRSRHTQASLTIELGNGRSNYDVQPTVDGCSYKAE